MNKYDKTLHHSLLHYAVAMIAIGVLGFMLMGALEDRHAKLTSGAKTVTGAQETTGE